VLSEKDLPLEGYAIWRTFHVVQKICPRWLSHHEKVAKVIFLVITVSTSALQSPHDNRADTIAYADCNGF
jgi:hypothetical protein